MHKPSLSTIAFWAALLIFVAAASLNYREQLNLPSWLRLPNWQSSLSAVPATTPVVQVVTTQEQAVEKVVEQSSPAVVSVVTRQVYLDLFRGPVSEEAAIGTGFIVRDNGIILTNKHVVDNPNATYTVVLADGKSYEVKKIALDPHPSNDLAIIKIEATGLPTLALGDSAKIKVGQSVVAIGNALGRFTNTVTTGIISGIGRGISAGDSFGQSESLDDVLQTDAALNPGNSGGPLLNLSGEVVGINVAISQTGQNIGFALPINLAKKTLDSYLTLGRIATPYIGLRYQMVTEQMARMTRLPIGAYVEQVIPGSGADKAGLTSGDVITKIDGQALNLDNTLTKIIRSHKIGDTVTLTVDRGGKELILRAELQEATTPSQ